MPRTLVLAVYLGLFSCCDSCFAQTDQAVTQAEAPQKPDNSVALKALVRLTRDQDAQVRMTAFSAIANIGEESPEVISAIESGLKDDDTRVRVESFMALTSAVKDSKVKVQMLLGLIEDEDDQLSSNAASQLGRLGEQAIPHLLEALKNEKHRLLIIQTFARLGPTARPAIPALTEQLTSDDPMIRALVADCLGKICSPRTRRSSSAFGSGRSSFSSARRAPDPATLSRMVDALWDRYDADGDGKLSREEQGRLPILDGSADSNGDMELSKAEFSAWYSARMRDRGRPPTLPGGFPRR